VQQAQGHPNQDDQDRRGREVAIGDATVGASGAIETVWSSPPTVIRRIRSAACSAVTSAPCVMLPLSATAINSARSTRSKRMAVL